MTSPDWPVQFILAGIPTPDPVRRPRHATAPPHQVHEAGAGVREARLRAARRGIKSYAKKAGLKVSIKKEDALVGRLCHAGQYQMGISIEILTEAIEAALDREADALEMIDFVEAYAARNLQPNDQNPFFAHAWDTIDASLLRPKSEDPEAEPDTGAGKTSRKKRSH